MKSPRILILCTGNSCRSQMAMRFLQACDSRLDVHSAGTQPTAEVNRYAVRVMEEAGVEMAGTFPKSVERYLREPWDYVITVCDHARENCPVFTGAVQHRLHLGFPDPALATGSDDEIMNVFRSVRDEIREAVGSFCRDTLWEEERQASCD